jgi:hypothetical protein
LPHALPEIADQELRGSLSHHLISATGLINLTGLTSQVRMPAARIFLRNLHRQEDGNATQFGAGTRFDESVSQPTRCHYRVRNQRSKRLRVGPSSPQLARRGGESLRPDRRLLSVRRKKRQRFVKACRKAEGR